MRLSTADITRKILSDRKELLISEFTFGCGKENELLLFLKPECFLAENPVFTGRIIEMVLNKLKKYDADISGSLLLSGKCLEESGIMDRHYGFINSLSKKASKIITDEKLSEIQKSLEIADIENYKVLGGHEFLLKYSGFNETSLDTLWLGKKSVKLRSGFYIQKYLINGKKFILVNGFHPAQLRHFTKPSHKILVLLLHSDTDWKILKNDLAGNTFPEKAVSSSIRGELFANSGNYGMREVSAANNCIHLSAGPFEALFEICNFLKGTRNVKFELSKTNIFRLMADRGFNKTTAENCMQNPVIEVGGKRIDLFTFTEDKNSSDAISGYDRYFEINK